MDIFISKNKWDYPHHNQIEIIYVLQFQMQDVAISTPLKIYIFFIDSLIFFTKTR